ncbi:MAG: MSHA biogenesis protein MshP [Aeromonadaceae bacterium]
MCLERRLRPSQSGSAVLIALFVIVIVGLLAAALSRLLLDASEKVTVEVLGVRALMAAQSGLEQGLYQLYPNGSWQAALPDTNGKSGCARVSTTLLAGNEGLSGCSVTIACSALTLSSGALTSYRLTSSGLCNGGGSLNDSGNSNPDFTVSRTLQAEAFDGGEQ